MEWSVVRKFVYIASCSEKCKYKKSGKMIQKDVGFPGGIEMKCTGGCLKIHKALYSCKMRDQSSPEQLKMVSSLCDYKEKCAVQARREIFGNFECPGTPDSDMALWITYSCDGGQDGTKECKKEGK